MNNTDGDSVFFEDFQYGRAFSGVG
jgi:hypothetical protein